MRRLALSLAPLFLLACGASVQYTDADIPKLTKIDDVMHAQSQVADAQMKKAGATAYTDDDYAAFTVTASRLKATGTHLKDKGLTRGPEFDKFADELVTHATELADAAGAKDVAKSSTALTSIKATCKGCHSGHFKELK